MVIAETSTNVRIIIIAGKNRKKNTPDVVEVTRDHVARNNGLMRCMCSR